MPQPPSSQQPSKRTTAKPSSANHPCLTLLCCPRGCAKVSRSNIFTHTQCHYSALLPRYHMTAAPLCPEAAPGALQGGTHCPEPHHLPPTPPWDRPPWGSSDPEENKGKSGPHTLLGRSCAGNSHTCSPGVVPLLPVLPTTVLILLQLPAHTHSGKDPHQPPEFCQ